MPRNGLPGFGVDLLDALFTGDWPIETVELERHLGAAAATVHPHSWIPRDRR
jgi:hypothetical protein